MCDNLPRFSLAFLGIGNLRGPIGMCRWWTICGAEFLLSILPATALSLSAPGWGSLAGHSSNTSTSCRLTLAPSSAAAVSLLLRGRPASLRCGMSSIVELWTEPTSSLINRHFLTVSRLESSDDTAVHPLIPQRRESDQRTTRAMFPGDQIFFTDWNLTAAYSLSAILPPPSGEICLLLL